MPKSESPQANPTTYLVALATSCTLAALCIEVFCPMVADILLWAATGLMCLTLLAVVASRRNERIRVSELEKRIRRQELRWEALDDFTKIASIVELEVNHMRTPGD